MNVYKTLFRYEEFKRKKKKACFYFKKTEKVIGYSKPHFISPLPIKFSNLFIDFKILISNMFFKKKQNGYNVNLLSLISPSSIF